MRCDNCVRMAGGLITAKPWPVANLAFPWPLIWVVALILVVKVGSCEPCEPKDVVEVVVVVAKEKKYQRIGNLPAHARKVAWDR